MKEYFQPANTVLKSQRDSTAALRDLITRLEPKEVASIRSKLRKAIGKKGTQVCKVSTLFEVLVARPCASCSDLAIAVYGHPDDSGLKYLRLRLFSKILETMAPIPAWPLSKSETQEMALLQMLTCARLLWQRGGHVALVAVLSVIVHKAGTSESYLQKIQALRLWRSLVQFRLEDTAPIDAQLTAANRAFQELQAVEALHEAQRFDIPRMATNTESEAGNKPEGSASPASKNGERAAYGRFTASTSHKVRFLGLSLELFRLHHTGKSQDILSLARQLAAYVSQQPLLANTPDYQAITQCHLAHAALLGGMPKMALEALATTAFPGDASPHIQWQAQLLAAEALRMGNKPAAALEAHQKLLLATQHDPSPLRQAVRHHLAASAAFQSQKSLIALQLLDGKGRAFQSHPDWNAAYRLLQIMAFVDAEQFDAAELRIDALRKTLPQLSSHPGLQVRYTAIVKVLQALVRSAFAFADVKERMLSSISIDQSQVGYPHAERISLMDWFQERSNPPTPVGDLSATHSAPPPESTARLDTSAQSRNARSHFPA